LFELTSLLPKSAALRAGGTVLRSFQYGNQDERNFVDQIFGLGRKKQARIHLLKNGNDSYGFIALSMKDFNKVPSVKIEYLFTSRPYRGIQYPDLGDQAQPIRVSEYLLGQAIWMANAATSMFSARNLFLQLIDDHLEPLYCDNGFTRIIGTDWMFLVLPSTDKHTTLD
jgi:hypothetical protein